MAVELSGGTKSAREQPHRVCTIPPDNDCPLPSGWSYEDGELYSSEEEEGDYVDWEEVMEHHPEDWEEFMEYWADPEDWDEFMEHWAHGM